MEPWAVTQINRTKTRLRRTQDQKGKMFHLKLRVILLFYHEAIQYKGIMQRYQLIELNNV